MTTSNLVFAGIGSRRTPIPTLLVMSSCGRVLAEHGWTLRSGAADGADTAFEFGARKIENSRIEIYLPWRKFPTPPHPDPYLESPKPEAYEIAAKYHPAWPYLKRTIKPLLARNVHQILGRDLDHPVRMIVCWTPDGCLDGQGPDCGGTGMALRIAVGEAPDAIVFNLAREDHCARIKRFCDSRSTTCVTSPLGETR